jgi:hypothetical protein
MSVENVTGGSSQINLGITTSWFIESPSSATINLLAYKASSGGTMGNVNDSNGRPIMQCIKIADTAYAGGIRELETGTWT